MYTPIFQGPPSADFSKDELEIWRLAGDAESVLIDHGFKGIAQYLLEELPKFGFDQALENDELFDAFLAEARTGLAKSQCYSAGQVVVAAMRVQNEPSLERAMVLGRCYEQLRILRAANEDTVDFLWSIWERPYSAIENFQTAFRQVKGMKKANTEIQLRNRKRNRFLLERLSDRVSALEKKGQIASITKLAKEIIAIHRLHPDVQAAKTISPKTLANMWSSWRRDSRQ